MQAQGFSRETSALSKTCSWVTLVSRVTPLGIRTAFLQPLQSRLLLEHTRHTGPLWEPQLLPKASPLGFPLGTPRNPCFVFDTLVAWWANGPDSSLPTSSISPPLFLGASVGLLSLTVSLLTRRLVPWKNKQENRKWYFSVPIHAWRELPSSYGRLLSPMAGVKKNFGHEFSSWLDSGWMAVCAKIRISERELGHQWGKCPPRVWINHQYWQIKLEGGLLMIQRWGRKGFGFFGTHTGGGGRQEEAGRTQGGSKSGAGMRDGRCLQEASLPLSQKDGSCSFVEISADF